MITTEGKTFQQVSDEIAAAVLKQGGRCVDDEGSCSYGDNKGRHCAIGWLLDPDNEDAMHYHEGIDDMLYTDIDLGPNELFIRRSCDMLFYLQMVHDCMQEDKSSHGMRQLESLENDFDIDMTSWRKMYEKFARGKH